MTTKHELRDAYHMLNVRLEDAQMILWQIREMIEKGGAADDPFQKVELLHRIARLQEDMLGDHRAAFETFIRESGLSRREAYHLIAQYADDWGRRGYHHELDGDDGDLAVRLVDFVLGYLTGSVPFAYLLARRVGIDVRKAGSGNVGAANVFRTTGKWRGIAAMALDVAGFHAEAQEGYRWLAGTQRPDGSWSNIPNAGTDLVWRSTHTQAAPFVNPAVTHLEIEWLGELAVAYAKALGDLEGEVAGPDVDLAQASGLAESVRFDRPELGVILLRHRLDVTAMARLAGMGIRNYHMVERADRNPRLLSVVKIARALVMTVGQLVDGEP